MGLTSSKSVAFGEPKLLTPAKVAGNIPLNLYDTKTGDPVLVNQPVIVPTNSKGDQVYNIYLSPITSPYQVLIFGNPFQDAYVVSKIMKAYDYNTIQQQGGQVINYTYLYSITGWSAFKDGNPVFQSEQQIVKCPTSSSCTSDSYPRCVMKSVNTLKFDVSVETSADNVAYMTTLNYGGSAMNAYIFVQQQARTMKGISLDHFQASLNAYLIVVNCITYFLPVNPFSSLECDPIHSTYNSLLTVQLTYPYMVYAQLIMLDAWFAVDEKFAAVWHMAVEFVSLYARSLWTVDESFEYGYLEPIYNALYKQGVIKNAPMWKLLV